MCSMFLWHIPLLMWRYQCRIMFSMYKQDSKLYLHCIRHKQYKLPMGVQHRVHIE